MITTTSKATSSTAVYPWFGASSLADQRHRQATQDPDAKSIVPHVSLWQFETEGAFAVILRFVVCLGLMGCASSTTKPTPDTSSLKAWVESHSNREIFALRLAVEPFFADPFLRLTSVDAHVFAPEWQFYEFMKLKAKRQTNDALEEFSKTQALFRKYSEYRFSRLQMLIQNEAEQQP